MQLFKIKYFTPLLFSLLTLFLYAPPSAAEDFLCNSNLLPKCPSAVNEYLNGSGKAVPDSAANPHPVYFPAGSGSTIGGNVGGYEFNVTDTPTVQAAAYASGNCMGGFRPITVARTNGGGLILTNFSVRSITGVIPTLQVIIFDASPAASTCTDKSTFTLNSADVAKVPPGGTFTVSLVAPTGATPTFGAATALNLNMLAGGSVGSGVATIYYALIATGPVSPGSTSDIQVKVSGVQD